MSATRALACIACLTASLAFAATPAAAAPPMVDALNTARAHHGLPALRHSPALARSSRRYARHLMRVNQFGHPRRIWGPARFSRLGETLFMRTGWRLRRRSTIRAWLSSPSHRNVLLSRGFSHVGAGRARGRFGRRPATIWVLHFGLR